MLTLSTLMVAIQFWGSGSNFHSAFLLYLLAWPEHHYQHISLGKEIKKRTGKTLLNMALDRHLTDLCSLSFKIRCIELYCDFLARSRTTDEILPIPLCHWMVGHFWGPSTDSAPHLALGAHLAYKNHQPELPQAGSAGGDVERSSWRAIFLAVVGCCYHTPSLEGDAYKGEVFIQNIQRGQYGVDLSLQARDTLGMGAKHGKSLKKIIYFAFATYILWCERQFSM